MQKEVGSLGSTGIVRIFFPENSVSIQRIALFEYMRKVSIICLLIIFFLYLKKKGFYQGVYKSIACNLELEKQNFFFE